MKIYCYNKCTTYKKALKFLNDHNIKYDYYEITHANFTNEDIKRIHEISNKDIKKLFNTSGKIYRELNLKEKIKTMKNNEKYELLSKNAMLIKRPILLCSDKAVIGFKESEFIELIKNR